MTKTKKMKQTAKDMTFLRPCICHEKRKIVVVDRLSTISVNFEITLFSFGLDLISKPPLDSDKESLDVRKYVHLNENSSYYIPPSQSF